MANEDLKQKLTAILSADVKDYSRLLSQERVSTINTLKAHRDLFADFIQQYGGIFLTKQDRRYKFTTIVNRPKLTIYQERTNRYILAAENSKPQDRHGRPNSGK